MRSRWRCRSTRRPPAISHARSLAAGHGEHPLDRRQRRAGSRRGRPASGARRGGRARAAPRRGPGRRSGRWPPARPSSELGVVARARSAVRTSSGDDVAPGDVVHQREQLVADPVAHEAGGRRWTGRRPAPSPSVGAQRRGLGPAQGEQRPGRCRAHRRQPVEPGAAQQVDQHRLGLVVGGVAGERRRRAARPAGRRGPGPRGSGPAATSTAHEPERRRRARRPAGRRASASAADSGRRPWSTWIARDVAPGGARRARARAVESAPPENAHVDARCPAGGNVQRASRSAVTAPRRRPARSSAVCVAVGGSGTAWR